MYDAPSEAFTVHVVPAPTEVIFAAIHFPLARRQATVRFTFRRSGLFALPMLVRELPEVDRKHDYAQEQDTSEDDHGPTRLK